MNNPIQIDNRGREVRHITPPKLSDLRRTLEILPDYFNLLRVFIWRMISVRYRQSVLGVVWVAAQPIVTTLVILLMFNIIGADTSDGAPRALFLFTGVMAWQFFARSVQDGTSSLVTNSGILTKIFLPRIMFPVAAILTAWLDLLVMAVFLIAACLYFGVAFSVNLLMLPVFLVLVSATALAIAIILSPVNALYRDVSFVIPFVLQFGMFLTPVLYTSRHVPDRWQVLYHLNPLSTLIEGVRWAVLPQSPAPDPVYLAINIACIVVALVGGLLVFQKLESSVVDRI